MPCFTSRWKRRLAIWSTFLMGLIRVRSRMVLDSLSTVDAPIVQFEWLERETGKARFPTAAVAARSATRHAAHRAPLEELKHVSGVGRAGG